jgi:hypothetical protein
MAIHPPGSRARQRAARAVATGQVGVSRGRIEFRPGIEAMHPRPDRASGAAPGEETGEFGVDRHANFIENTLLLHRPAPPSEDATIE